MKATSIALKAIAVRREKRVAGDFVAKPPIAPAAAVQVTFMVPTVDIATPHRPAAPQAKQPLASIPR